MAIKPTFKNICDHHQLGSPLLASLASELPYAVVDMMLQGEPVREDHAKIILSRLSFKTGANYTLENMDVPLVDHEEAHS